MRERLRRWSEDETVGKALVAAGIVFLIVQGLPEVAIAWLRRLWPIVIIGIGALLLLRRRPPAAPAPAPPSPPPPPPDAWQP